MAENLEQSTTDVYDSRVVEIRRTTKVREGGRDFSFSALAVVGDGNGRVGFGKGKGKEVILAVQEISLRKCFADNMMRIMMEAC